MNSKSKIIITAAVMLLLGLALAALDGRVDDAYISIRSVSAVLLTTAFFLGSEGSGNALGSFFLSVGGVLVPVSVWVLVLRKKTYLGYDTGTILTAAFVCGAIVYADVLLTRHQTGPLRAAFGRTFLPCFFGAAAAHKLIPYFRDIGSFSLNFKDELCFTGMFLAVIAVGSFIAANREHIGDKETYLSTLIWGGCFAALLMIGGKMEKDLVPILF